MHLLLNWTIIFELSKRAWCQLAGEQVPSFWGGQPRCTGTETPPAQLPALLTEGTTGHRFAVPGTLLSWLSPLPPGHWSARGHTRPLVVVLGFCE